MSANVAEPWKRTTTVAVACAPTLTSSWRAIASAPPLPVIVMKTGSATSASAGTSTVNTRGAAAQVRALIRSVGTKPLRPRSEAETSTDSARTPSGASTLNS